MEIVIDTSAILAVLLNESNRELILTKTLNSTLIAPVSIDAEIGNAFSAMFKRGRIELDKATTAVRKFEMIPIRRVNVDIKDSLQLCFEQDIYAYDAYMLHCASSFSKPILSLDKKLLEIAKNIGIQTIEV